MIGEGRGWKEGGRMRGGHVGRERIECKEKCMGFLIHKLFTDRDREPISKSNQSTLSTHTHTHTHAQTHTHTLSLSKNRGGGNKRRKKETRDRDRETLKEPWLPLLPHHSAHPSWAKS